MGARLLGANKKTTIISLILLLPFLVWFSFNTSDYNQKQDGTLYVGLEIPFYGIDVLRSGGMLNPETTTMSHLVMDRLFTLGATGQVNPMLGLTAQCSEDGKAWDLTLRKGVKFHDGVDFNADAVVHHWKRILDPKNKFRGRAFFEPVTDIEKINPYQVRFLLKHPWGAFLKVISDETYSFAYIPSPKAVKDEIHNEAPVGTGPYRFHKWNNGDHFSVVRNDDYWEKGKPFLERIVFRHIPDAQTLYASLVSDQVDLIAVDRGTIIQKAQKNDAFRVYPSNGSGAEIILINVEKPPLNDIRVRKALALANNQKLQIKMVYQNTTPYIHHPFGEQFICEDVNYPEHDLKKASALIKDYGQPIEIECIHSNTLRGRNIGELLQQLYGKIGVKLNLVPLHAGGQIMRVVEKKFQLATWRILSARDHGTGLLRNFHSQSKGNWSGIKNHDLDRMLEAQQREENPYLRQKILCQIAGFINENALFLYRSGRRFHVIANKKANNIVLKGEMIDLTSTWIKGFKDNVWAKRNEQNAKSPVDCSDPGDTEAIKQAILGPWKGRDNYGAVIQANFFEDGKVHASRNERQGSVNYTICGDTVFWRPPGALLVVTIKDSLLKGYWEYSGYKGEFTLKKQVSVQASAE